jgi:trehalose/maltose hydrolase-like predicted phosphorylase
MGRFAGNLFTRRDIPTAAGPDRPGPHPGEPIAGAANSDRGGARTMSDAPPGGGRERMDDRDLDSAWNLVFDGFDPAHNRSVESLTCIGNGYLSVRGSVEEGLSGDPQNRTWARSVSNISIEPVRPGRTACGTFIPGVWGDHPTLGEQMVNLPHVTGIELVCEGERFDLESSRLREHRRRLDLRTGVLHRSFTWLTRAGGAIEVTMRRYAHACRHNLIVQEVVLRAPDGETTAEVGAWIDTDVRTNGYDHFPEPILGASPDGAWCEVEIDGRIRVAAVSRVVVDAEERDVHRRPWRDERRAGMNLTLPLTQGRAITVTRLCALCDSRGGPHVRKEAEAVIAAAARQRGALIEEHCAWWRRMWEQADLRIDGPTTDQLALRFAIFHLMRARPFTGSRMSVGSRLASGDLYCGHVFWDSEMFLLPFYLHSLPDGAREMILYRIATVPGAESKAQSRRSRGAMYAWQSARTGLEMCPSWQYADLQVHVSAAVIFGIRHYIAATGDASVLTAGGARVIEEVARFWRDRADRRPGSDGWHILGVMGPDEYTHFDHNNSYTNRLARYALETAGQWLGRLTHTRTSEAERAAFAEIADSLPMPYDQTRGLVLQSEGFEALAEVDLAALRADRDRPVGAQVAQEKLYRSRVLKQPDVLMLMTLFPNEYTREQIATAFDHYEPLTTHDSSLSPPVHAMAASLCGRPEVAYEFWRKAAFTDIDDLYGNGAEGLHESALGGTWMAAVYGFAGVTPAYLADALAAEPRLPRGWSAMGFALSWRGKPYRVCIDSSGTQIRELR